MHLYELCANTIESDRFMFKHRGLSSLHEQNHNWGWSEFYHLSSDCGHWIMVQTEVKAVVLAALICIIPTTFDFPVGPNPSATPRLCETLDFALPKLISLC